MKSTFPHRSARSGFTLLELLIVIAIIGILAAIAFPATGLVMNQARKTQASTQIEGIVGAIKLYETTYSKLPFPAGQAGEQEIPTESDFIDILTGADSSLNPKEQEFLSGKQAKKPAGNKPARAGFVSEGDGSRRLVDPWGNEYVVMMDGDGDNKLQVPGETDQLNTLAVAWSYGKPKSSDDYKSAADKEPDEWIKSW